MLLDEHVCDPDDTGKRVHWILATIYFISWNFDSSPRFNGRLIDNGLIHKLLQIVPELKEEDPRFWTYMIIGRVIRCKFWSSSYQERSIHIKGIIFSKLAMFIDITEKAGSTTMFVRRTIELFFNYLNLEEWQYYKSTVKTLLKDGTIFRIVKMYKDMAGHDRQFIEMYIVCMIVAFSFVRTCVEDTVYEHKLLQVELRILNRIAIRHFPAVCKDASGYAVRNTAVTTTKLVGYGDRKEIQFFIDNKVFKKFASTFVTYFRSNEHPVDYPKLNEVILCLIALVNSVQFQSCMTLRDVRPLLPHLPALVDSKKYTAGPPEFFANRLLLVSNVIMGKFLLKEEHYSKLKEANILALFVETAKAYHGKDCIIEHLALPMLMYCIVPAHLTECWLTLSEIDQVIPGIPLLISSLTGFDRTLDLLVSPLCLCITRNLVRVKEDRMCDIRPQLKALRESDFVAGIGQALICSENSSIIFQLMAVLEDLSQLFDGREFMRNLVDLLPELAKKQYRFLEVGNSFLESKDFMTGCVSIMRKAAAYILDDLDPIFVEDVIADQVMGGWKCFRISGKKLFFSSDPYKTEEKFEVDNLCDEPFIDVLRATWQMIGKFPDLINTKLPKVSPLFETDSRDGDITGLTARRIIQTVISYLDHSQDKSSEFLSGLTAFVKDLAQDAISSEENRPLFKELVSGCERFLEVNCNKTFVDNLQYFINANSGVLCDGYLLD